MGKPLMIQKHDDDQIELLKKKLGMKTKIDVVRAGLSLLQADLDKAERQKAWKKAVDLVASSSRETNKEFQSHSPFKKGED